MAILKAFFKVVALMAMILTLLAGSSQGHTTKKPSPPVAYAPSPAPSSEHHQHHAYDPSPAPSPSSDYVVQSPVPSQTNAVALRAVPFIGEAVTVGVLASVTLLF
ncbi:hypothetical protein J5N97_020676 [Dioscorea zingiberensis]|uniref:Uncharacterized protein n=1 Tax=Dioscorea zingiberensis TaxID=325984 RepID=A0A9D5CHJ9_9LILI|nr:hypothetical protein J5N97_020676 [Dioscorea zingiberensis]